MTKTTLASLLAAAAGLLAGPAAADAATTAGSDLTAPAATSLECASACTLAWGAHGWFDRRLMDGTIVTRWAAHLAPGTRARLRLVRREDDAIDGPVTAVAASDWVTGSAAGGVQSFRAHLPVSEYGLRFAVDVEGGALGLAADGSRDFGVVRLDPVLGPGETRSGDMRSGEPLMQVTAEGDADLDGKGDETEDDCVHGCAPAGGSGNGAPSPAPAATTGATVTPASTGSGTSSTPTARRPAFQVDPRGLLRAGAQGRQGWFDVFVLNDGAASFDAHVVVKSRSRRVGGGKVEGLEGGDGEKLAVRLGARERRALARKGKVRLTLEGSATLVNGYKHEIRQALTVVTGGDARYDGTYRGPGPFVLVVERGTVQTINAGVLGFCPETNRRQSLNIFTVAGFPALVGRDGSFDMTGNAVSQSNTYRGKLSLKGTGRGYASAFKTHMNMSSGGRLVLEGCTGATNWTVKRSAR